MERILNTMQDPDKLSDPRAPVVQTAGDVASFPQIPGYRVVKKLGQGGMATVYMATQESLDRPVSIKVMERETLQDETSMQRFENEARTIAKLTHPSIVSIYEVGRTADGRMYYTMPYLPNGDLAQRDLAKDEPRIIALLRTLLSALDYAHTRGIVHRDVKQENVLFDSDNRPLLADFGIALSKADAVRITTAGLAVGSSGYMAPEQARGDAVDGRADLYSVGVLAYELLTGELPYRSNDALALALMHVQKEIPRLPAAKRHWQPFIDRAMAKSPDDRFENARQMLDALDRIDRRSGNHLTQRMLRTLDRTAPGNGWKRPRMLALIAALAIAGGVYAERDRLPSLAPPVASTQTPASPASPAVAPGAVASNTAASSSSTAASNAPATTAAASPAASSTASPGAPPATSSSVASAATAPPTNAPPVATPTPAPPVVAPPTAPPVATASSTPPTPPTPPAATAQTPVQAALANARAELEHANLTAPPGKNAVDLTRAAWALAPATSDTKKLADDVLKALSAQQVLAISQHNDARATEYEQKAELLANTTVGESGAAWRSLRGNAANALLARAQKEASASDSAALARSQSLAKQLGQPTTLAQIVIAPVATNPGRPGANPPTGSNGGLLANIDTGFIKLHDRMGVFPAAAIQRAEVTRHDYEIFANATHRPPADCSNPKVERPDDASASQQRFGQDSQQRFGFRRAREMQAERAQQTGQAQSSKTWSNPGYLQSGDHPVVCVNWNDANAYAQWLTQRTGHRYRLPSITEWRIAIAAGGGSLSAGRGTVPAVSGSPNSLGLYGLDGNVSEWLLECGLGCDRHQVAGRSWRDRGTDMVPSGRMTERAFDDVGFRVVEVLGTRN